MVQEVVLHLKRNHSLFIEKFIFTDNIIKFVNVFKKKKPVPKYRLYLKSIWQHLYLLNVNASDLILSVPETSSMIKENPFSLQFLMMPNTCRTSASQSPSDLVWHC